MELEFHQRPMTVISNVGWLADMSRDRVELISERDKKFYEKEKISSLINGRVIVLLCLRQGWDLFSVTFTFSEKLRVQFT